MASCGSTSSGVVEVYAETKARLFARQEADDAAVGNADDALAYDEKAFDKRIRNAEGAAELLEGARGLLAACTAFDPPSLENHLAVFVSSRGLGLGAIVHAHSTYCTTLAIARREIPACHYMIAASGGPTIRCAGYATYGTKELSELAIEALKDRTCCLLANHGMIATGANVAKAMWLAVEFETIAKQYYLSLAIGGPVLLPDDEIANVMEKFKGYGLQSKDEASSVAPDA